VPNDVASRWIRNPSDEAALAEGCTFDPDAGAFVAEFFSRFLRHSIGRFAGEPFTLLPWQRDLADRLYGWKRPDGTRRYREAYVEIPKKNGKSTLLAGLELLHLVADGEAAAEVYSGAKDRQQAGIIYKEASNMVRASPELAARLQIVPSAKRLIYPATNSFLQALSADVGSKEGLNASFIGSQGNGARAQHVVAKGLAQLLLQQRYMFVSGGVVDRIYVPGLHYVQQLFPITDRSKDW